MNGLTSSAATPRKRIDLLTLKLSWHQTSLHSNYKQFKENFRLFVLKKSYFLCVDNITKPFSSSMVCKKSLYCLKNGPCATYQLRKQIWEDNIRFRESLRNINQSDHYWSFQITNNEFSDLDEPSFYKKRNKSCMKLRNCYDCASVTHEFSKESAKTCLCNKNMGNGRNYPQSKTEKEDSPETKAMLVRPSKQIQTHPLALDSSNPRLHSCNNYSRMNKNVSEYCHKYRNSLSSAQLLPSSKVKFSSQSTLYQPRKSVDLKRYPSIDVLSRDKNYLNYLGTEKKADEKSGCDKEEKKHLNNIKLKNDILRNKEVKLAPWLSGTPLSRTTRKMLNKDKQIPFTTFGCNNTNDIVGLKKTHNVYASTKEIFPNALSAKQQREEMILNSLKKEKLFRNSILQDSSSKKLINHSSLWASEGNKDHFKESCSLLRNKAKKLRY